MLSSSFLFTAGISKKSEHLLWAKGYFTWDDYLNHPAPVEGLPPEQIITRTLREAKSNRNNPEFFAQRIPRSEHWRLFPEYMERAMYLDIETDGLHREKNRITAIGAMYKDTLRSYIAGKNLEAFKDFACHADMIISFNGIRFDVPFIEHHLGIRMNQIHLDLMHIFRSYGITGGLKKIENHFGLSRGDLSGLGGIQAVQLWKIYNDSGDENALETLLAYNAEDVRNLKTLMIKAYNLRLRETIAKNIPLMEKLAPQDILNSWISYADSLILPESDAPPNPYKVSFNTENLLSA